MCIRDRADEDVGAVVVDSMVDVVEVVDPLVEEEEGKLEGALQVADVADALVIEVVLGGAAVVVEGAGADVVVTVVVVVLGVVVVVVVVVEAVVVVVVVVVGGSSPVLVFS
eukprot:TRINITY_DN12588_c0_g1_i1.p2 TRINITY_DN12588_c0_g1~~TRINITY_DN12588_c0_g1_i1.p2  ORF type:complete len:111 (-),score=34.11 TRINITY_DN12588_c0_g1_i1:218-550(-)